MQFMERIIGMFTKPEETLKDILKEPRTEEPLLIVGILAIIWTIGAIIPVLHTGAGLSIVSAILALAGVLIGWPIATGIVHIFALFLGGEGKYSPQMLNAIGYTYIVKIIPAVVAIILLLFMPTVSMDTVPQVTADMSAGQIREAMQPIISAMERSLFSPIFIISLAIGYLALIWSCYLGALAVKEGDKVSKTTAYIAVFVPMVVSILLGLLVTYGSYLIVKMMYG